MARDVCFYDGRCGMCRRTTRVLRRLDWLGRLDFVDLTTLPPDALPVPLEDAMRGMPMRTRGGRVLVGFPAVRRALARTPLGLLPGLALYLPGVSWVGARSYERLAAGRRREVCGVAT